MKRKNNFRIYKASGNLEDFSRKKLFSSLKRSGLPYRQCQLITEKVAREVQEGSKTRDIYRKTHRMIKGISPVAAAHYSLKRAIFELGPTGHSFEDFVAKYFETIGFTTETCRTIKGKFVSHEVDVLAKRANEKYFVECKFHNRVGIKNDIKIALYVKARWDDLKEGPEGKTLSGFYLASNTAFSQDAIAYAAGTGLRLLGVNAPTEDPFLEQIKRHRLYPITSLKRLNKHLRLFLFDQKIILARELLHKKELLLRRGMTSEEILLLFEEINMLQENHI